MRSLTYLQPGENVSCVGCHEPRTAAPPPRPRAAGAWLAAPSAIAARPRRLASRSATRSSCSRCSTGTACRATTRKKPEGKVVLTGEPQGHYTASYNALAPRVSYSAWGGKPGDFRRSTASRSPQPGFFGARGSTADEAAPAGPRRRGAHAATRSSGWPRGWTPTPCSTARSTRPTRPASSAASGSPGRSSSRRNCLGLRTSEVSRLRSFRLRLRRRLGGQRPLGPGERVLVDRLAEGRVVALAEKGRHADPARRLVGGFRGRAAAAQRCAENRRNRNAPYRASVHRLIPCR